jgi:chloramphenicol 3-O phosphotransferase
MPHGHPPVTGAIRTVPNTVHPYGFPMSAADMTPVQVVVLNGGSSAGKTTVSRQLQQLLLPETWLRLGVDTLLEALPPELLATGSGIEFAADGSIEVGEGFRRAEAAWARGIAAMAQGGTGVIVDEVLLGGATSQARWRQALDGLRVLWVGVRCEAEVAERREAARGDRITGMARSQAESVHLGVRYDLVVDSSRAAAEACAEEIAAALRGVSAGAGTATADARPEGR